MKLQFNQLEPRDCPASLLAVAGAGDYFPGYSGPITIAASGNVLAVVANDNHVAVFVGTERTADFYAYDLAFMGGVNLAVDPDTGNVATGTNIGAPHVRVLDTHGVELQSCFAGDPLSLHGVQVAYRGSSPATPDAYQFRPEARTQIYVVGGTSEQLQQVAVNYSAYNVGVTNVYPNQTEPTRIATVILRPEPIRGIAGTMEVSGIATINGAFQQSALGLQPAYVFTRNLATVGIARVISHEAAHLFGVDHDNDTNSIMFPGVLPGPGRFLGIADLILSQRLR